MVKVLVTTVCGEMQKNGVYGAPFFVSRGEPTVTVIEFDDVTHATAAAKAVNNEDRPGYRQNAVVLA
jgi:hypothetical protein